MIDAFNAIIAGLGAVLSTLISILPDSPFTFVANIESSWVQAINYILPVSEAVAHLELFVTAAVVYYALRIVFRWVKAVGA